MPQGPAREEGIATVGGGSYAAVMRVLLLSRGTGAVTSFLSEAVAVTHRPLRLGYLDDAQAAYAEAPFVKAERAAALDFGHALVPITVRDLPALDIDRALAELDAVYVASGSTFALLEALRTSGADRILVDRVRAGLPYIGSSAGSIVAGPDITPASLMDDPADGPALTSFAGLGLVDHTVIPHADGKLPPYPPELIERTINRYGGDYPLITLRDDQALLVADGRERVVDSGPVEGAPNAPAPEG